MFYLRQFLSVVVVAFVAAVLFCALVGVVGYAWGYDMYVTNKADVVFRWDANDPAEGVTGYKLHRGTAPGVYGDVLDVGDVLTAQWMFPDGEWYVAASAYDGAGNESATCDPIVVKVDTVPPSPPSKLIITSVNKYSATVFWEPVPGATAYRVMYGSGSNVYQKTVSVDKAMHYYRIADAAWFRHTYARVAAVLPDGLVRSDEFTVFRLY